VGSEMWIRGRVYHPFEAGRRELIHTSMGLTVDRAAMSFGARL